MDLLQVAGKPHQERRTMASLTGYIKKSCMKAILALEVCHIVISRPIVACIDSERKVMFFSKLVDGLATTPGTRCHEGEVARKLLIRRIKSSN